MPDPYTFTPLRDHISNVLTDYRDGLGDGLDDSVQAIFDHPEFNAAWGAYLKTKPPKHGERREIGGQPLWWDAREQVWACKPLSEGNDG